MARLQILELPEGTDDVRPPFVLVVDQCEPQRLVIGIDQQWQDHWQMIADRIGARAVIVTPETVEIPANNLTEYRVDPFVPDPAEAVRRLATVDDESEQRARHLESKLKEFAEAHHRENVDRMDAVTDALGLGRLRDWDEIVSAIKRQRQTEVDGGHRFLAVPERDGGRRCSVCGVTRDLWADLPDTPTCAAIRERGYY